MTFVLDASERSSLLDGGQNSVISGDTPIDHGSGTICEHPNESGLEVDANSLHTKSIPGKCNISVELKFSGIL